MRVIVLAGEGKSFSAGADLDWMRRMAQASEADNRADAERLATMLRAVAECPKPVVARVHGAALGGGAGLTAASDIAVAAESTVFGFSEVRLGLAPSTIAPHVIEKIGLGAALPRFLLGERFDAAHRARHRPRLPGRARTPTSTPPSDQRSTRCCSAAATAQSCRKSWRQSTVTRRVMRLRRTSATRAVLEARCDG